MKASMSLATRFGCCWIAGWLAVQVQGITVTSTEFQISGGWAEDSNSGMLAASSTTGATLNAHYWDDYVHAEATVSSFALDLSGQVQNHTPAYGEPGYVSYAALSMEASAVTRFYSDTSRVLLSLRGKYGPFVIQEAYEDPLSHMGLAFRDLTTSETLLNFEWWEAPDLWEPLHYGIAYDLNPAHEYELALTGSFDVWAGTLDWSDINARVEVVPVPVPEQNRSLILLSISLAPLLYYGAVKSLRRCSR